MNELPPLSDLARALVAEEQHALAARAELRARVAQRLESAMPGMLDAPIAAPLPPTGADAAGTAGTTAAAGTAGTAGALAKPVTLAAGKLAAVLATTFAVGAMTGAAIDRRTRGAEPVAPRETPTVVATTAPPEPAPTPTTSALTSASPQPSVTATPTPTPTLMPTPTPSADRKSDLARERALIDAARSGLAHDNPAAALDAVRRHAEAFPHGQLSEERDALRVLALASSGRRDEAKRAATSFRARYPQSLFLPQIDAALGASP